MKKLSLLLITLTVLFPAGVRAQAIDQLFGNGEALEAPVPVPAAPAAAAGEDYGPMPDEVAYFVNTPAVHEAGAELFDPFSSAKSLYTDKSKIPYLMTATAQAKALGVDLDLVLAVIQQESGFDPKAKSSAGACGLMQLLPDTAKWLGLKDTSQIWKPEVNIKYGTKYLKYLWGEFGEGSPAEISKEAIDLNTSQMAVAAYNAGPGNVRKYKGVPPFKETKAYVRIITSNFKHYTDLLAMQ